MRKTVPLLMTHHISKLHIDCSLNILCVDSVAKFPSHLNPLYLAPA